MPEGRRRPLLRGIAALLALGLVWLLFVRARGPGEIPADALRAADDAGCGIVEHPAAEAPAGVHLEPGERHTYADPPAASGPHDPSPLPGEPRVHGEPIAETRAVHNLEHAYVIVYYRAPDDGGLAPDAVGALEAYVEREGRVLMAPYPDLPDGTALALVAWNTRWSCPAGVTPEQAVTISSGFVQAYRGTTVAPEAPRGLLGPLLSG